MKNCGITLRLFSPQYLSVGGGATPTNLILPPLVRDYVVIGKSG